MKPNTLKVLVSEWFASAGKLYGEEPYEVHNTDVRTVLRRFNFDEQHYEHLHLAAELHDVFEDLPKITPAYVISLNIDIRAIIIALLLTNEKPLEGDFETRSPGESKEDAKIRTYRQIRTNEGAIIVKLADRIANVERGDKINKYRKEHDIFRNNLFKFEIIGQPQTNNEIKMIAMWKYLDDMITPQLV